MKTKHVALMIKYGQLVLIDNRLVQGEVENVKLSDGTLYGRFRGFNVFKPLEKGIWLEKV